MQVYIADAINELSDEAFEKALLYVDEDRRERILKFRFMADKKRSLVGTLLTGYVISKALGTSPGEVKYGKNKYGKPFVEDHDDIQFNISHSGDYVALIIGKKPVGIDVQELKTGFDDIAERFFSKEEKEILASADNRKELFYEMWSLKEAYIKAIGKGLSQPLNEFGVVQRDGKYRLIIKGEESHDYNFKKYELADYSLCACAVEDSFPTDYVKVSCKEILDHYNSV